MTLAEFLLARIADDEMAAQDAAKYGAPKWDEDNAQCWTLDGQKHIPMTEAESRHIGRFDPDRVLAECQAKRAVVAACMGDDPDQGELDPKFLDERVPALVLRALALPYASHPDYDEAWKP